MKELSKKKYVTLITIMILILGIIGIVNIGNIDLDKGKVKLKSASIEKLKSSVIESKGYEEITYPVLYELEKVEGIEERNVIIKGTLTKEENKYARFKEITSKTITSTVSENGREIEIKIEKVKLGRQNKINIKIEINGAINETKIKPEIEIKEESEKEYTKVNTEEIEVKTNSVTGLVQDEEGMSVSNLELSINKGNEEIRRTYTDENGRYVFSDVEEGKYIIKVEEENYELKEIKEVEVIGGITENIIVKKIKPYEIEVKKYISKIKLNNNGKEIEYEYGKLNKVNQTVKNLKNLSGEIEYKIEIKNTGEKSGEITKIEEEVTEGLKFNKEKNSEWEEKNGKIINRSLEGIKLKAGEEKEITLKLDIEKTDEARSYLQKVTAKGEVYQNVVYILGGKEYRKEKVLDGEKIEEPKIVQENFKGWYTDKKYTNKYNFENSVTKDIILYGKIEESTKKYTVQYIDEGKIIKEEELEEGSIINAPEVTKEGHTFIGWYEGEEKYDVYEPITRNLILESKYEINKYKVRFINEDGSVLQEETLNYGSAPTYKKETPTKKRTEEYTYEFDKWTPEITKVTSNQEYKATYKETKNKYTVTYINDGEEYHKETVEYGSVITSIQDPIKEGYTFIGWYTKDNEKVTHPITVTKNITLYSKYEVNSYKVSYYNEGKKYIDDQKINYGENALKPKTDPSKIGYTFKYWSLKENGEEYEFSTKITKDIALYAVYEINKYTVTYINEGIEYHKETAEYGSVITSIQNPIKEGYTFIGWYNENNEKVTHPITVTEDITLHSKYEINTYTVSFYHNNEKYVEDQKVNYGESAVKPSIDPTKEDYNFSGWVIKGTNNKYDFTSKVTKDIELESSFTAKPTYTVTYKIGNEVILTENVIEGHKVTSKEAPYKKGYLFDKWYSDEGLTIENNFDEKIMNNKTIYGKYNENKHTVTYINEGTTYYTEEVLDSFTAKGPNTNPEKEGYTFKYFSKDKKVAFDYNVEITEDTTLYAVYEINKYTVTYINEGSEYHKEELTYGSKHEKIEDPFKTGYTFIGWYNENEEKVEYPITVTKDITLHSKYEINKYTVTFNDEDRITTKEVNYNAKVEPVTNQGKTGYTFKYWSKEKGGEEYNFNTLVTENITLYAVYSINKYTVTFKNYDGSTLQEETLEYGALPKYKGEAPTREKTKEYTYTFKGWDKEITEVTNNQEYIATYTETKNKYNVKFTNYDGSVLQEETLEYGIVPVYKGEVPTREKTEEYTYTFKGWNKEITEVTDNEIYIAVYKEEKNKYTVIYMDGENEYTRKEVNYGETVSEEIISKDHNIYRGWTLDGNVYDFSTPVTKNITIKSSFELVESPIIESTPIEWTKEDVKVTITTNHSDYSYMYKIDDGEYQNYNGEFTVDKNCTVIAKSIKENVESEVTTKEITNIDKVLPEIKEITEENITTKSFDIKVKGQDNESGLSEIRIYKNEELMVSYPYTERLNEEKEETYSLTGLEENTTYKIKVELIDKVGNVNVSEEKEITTLKRVIVSRIIGRNNSLYESEEEYELFESLEEAITSCGSNECTIEMVLDTKESVNVLEGQEIKLELNGKTVTGVRDYTIENSGELIIVDKEDSEGGIINNTDTAIKNIGNGILQIGENEEPLSVSMTIPNIVGTTYGIYTEEETSKLKFYDGKIEGNVAIQGNVDDTPYLYNAKITNEGHQVATLSILAEAEAKITGGKYYTKLSSALTESQNGTYGADEYENIMKSAVWIGEYSFNYNEEEKSLTSSNKGVSNSTAHSYIKLDLTDKTKQQLLTIDAEISSENGCDYGYITITDNKNIPNDDQTEGRKVLISGAVASNSYEVILEPGKVYYMHIGYRKDGSADNGSDTFTISNITLNDYDVINTDLSNSEIITTGTYGFTYSDGVLKSNNQNKDNTTASSYLTYDLTNYQENQKIYVNAEVSSEGNYDFGYVTINDSIDTPSYDNATGRIICISGDVTDNTYVGTLKAGIVNYVHFGYRKDGGSAQGTDTFTINNVYMIDRTSETTEIAKKVPILNEKVDTVELVKDITLSSSIEIPDTKALVLDLKGKTLTTTSNDYVIKNSGDLTIIDSKYYNDIEKNQADYEAEQAKYDEEYNAELSAYNKAKEDYEKSVEEYEKKLEEYNTAHPNKNYEYTGKEEIYVVPEDGTYKLETWGAQGGSYNETYHGGYGGYSSGYITLKKGDKLYINVGGQGSYIGPYNTGQGGYNGGGSILLTHSDGNEKRATGGGATHISLKSGLLSTLENSKDDILIVSGGGGATQVNSAILDRGWGIGGSGGGISGSAGTGKNYSTDVIAPGGTQTQSTEGNINSYSGVFGKGGENSSTGNSSGGGGGFYGGSSSLRGAGGGSGYIGNSKLTNKAMYCYNCEESSDGSTKTISTNDVSETPIANYAKKGAGYAKVTKVGSEDATDFNYTGDVQEYNVPKDGKYKIELWGASGGIASDSSVQGRGGYTSGTIDLKKNDKLYIYVGERGSNSKSTTFNGGGSGGNSNLITSNSQVGNSGGGATDVRLEKGKSWSNFDSLKSRIMVAGGSGGGSGNTLYENAGNYSAAGGLIGYDGGYYSGHSYSNQNGKGATQTSGGKAGNNHFSATGVVESGTFGKGGNNYSYSDNTGAGGGGGGYYGGGAGGGTLSEGYGQGAGGGSSFISGHEGCDSISKDSTENNIIHTGKSLHYSNYIFTDTKIIDGLGYEWTTEKTIKTGMPTYDGLGTITGNLGNGHAKITKIDENEETITKPVMPEILKDNNVEMKSDNFSYKALNSSSSGMNISDKKVNFYTSWSNTSVTYYTKKVTVEEGQKLRAKGSLGLWHNYNNGSSLGTAYIGFSKTNDISTTDFDSYTTREITSTTEQKDDFDVMISEPGEYYFKIVLYHISYNSNTLYANLYNLLFTSVPQRKYATLKETALTGTVESTTNSVIYNDFDANLTIRDGIFSLDKSGEYNIITNEGTLSILQNSTLNTKQQNNRAVYNGYYANIKDGGGTINQNSNGYGIYSVSRVDDGFSNITFNLSSGYAFYNRSANIVVNNIKTNGYNATVYNNGGTLTINDSILNSSINSNGIVEINNTNHRTYGTRSSGYRGRDNYNGTMTINNSNFRITADDYSNGISGNNDGNTVTINDSTIDIDSYYSSITGITNLFINNSNISEWAGYDNLISCTNVIVKGNSKIEGMSPGELIRATNLTVGEKDGNIDEYPKIISNRGSTLSVNNFYMYDGSITFNGSYPKDRTYNGYFKEVEDNSELKVTLTDSSEMLSLFIPTDPVAQIGEKTYLTLQSAIDNVKNGETIQLLSDIYPIRSIDISENSDFTIDLNTHEIRAFNSGALFKNKGVLTILDSNESNKGTINKSFSNIFENNGILTLNNFNLSAKDVIDNNKDLNINNMSLSSSSGYLINNNESSNVTIDKSTINGNINNKNILSISSSSMNSGRIDSLNGVKLTVNDSNINVTIDSKGELITNNNTIRVLGNSGNYISHNDKINNFYTSGTTDLYDFTGNIENNTNGTLNIHSGNISYLLTRDSAITNILDGTYSGNVENIHNGIINISGGTLRNVSNNNSGTINIGVKDGNVSTEIPVISNATGIAVNNQSGTINFYDGIIKGTTTINGPINEIEDGYDIIKEVEDNINIAYLSKKYAAQLGSTDEKYYTVQEAVDAASNDGDTIKILRELTTLPSTETIIIPENKNITLDLNGYKINQYNDKYIENNGTLTFKDTNAEVSKDGYGSTIYKGTIISNSGTIVNNNGSLKFESGTFTSNKKTSNLIINTSEMVVNGGYITSSNNSSSVINNAGILTINEGTINLSSNSDKMINNTGTLTINGGSFTGTTGSNGSMSYIIYNYDKTNIYGGTINIGINVSLPVGFITSSSTGALVIDGLTNVYSPIQMISSNGSAVIKNSQLTGRIYNSGTMDLYDTTMYKAENAWDDWNGIYNYDKNVVNIHSGEYSVPIENDSAGTINIESGTFDKYYIYNNQSGVINIENATVTDPVSNRNTGTINIKNGSYTKGVTNTSSGTINIGTKGDINDSGELNVSIENPNITGDTYGLSNSSNGKVNFYDGIISGTTDAVSGTINEIEDGYEIISGTTEDGKKSKYLSRLPVAEVESTGDTYYTLQEAVDAVTTPNETIKLLRRYTTLNTLGTTTIPEGKNIVLDLNGYTLEQNNENFLVNNGTLKIIDSSENNDSKIKVYSNKLIENNGTMTMDKVKINVENNVSNVITNNSIMTISNSEETNSNKEIGPYINNTGTISLIESTFNSNTSGSTIIRNSGILNITNGTYNVVRGTLINNSNELNINGGTYSNSDKSYNNGNTLIMSSSDKDITIDSISTSYISTVINNTGTGTFKYSNSTIDGSIINNGTGTMNLENITSSTYVYNYKNGILTLKDSTFYRVENRSGQVDITNTTFITSGGTSILTSENGITNIYSATLNNGCIENNNSHTINIYNIDITRDRYSVIYNYHDGGTINIFDANINNTPNGIHNGAGTINISNINMTTTNTSINNSGVLNITNGTVTVTSSGNGIENSGTVNIGSKDGNVSTEMPVITGKTYGVSNGGSGKVNFYDGIVSGETGAFYGTVNEVEPGYKIVTNKNDTLTSATLSLIGDDEKVAVLNGINFTSLQDAINSASDTNESIITLYKDVTFESNITVPANKNIKLYLNGNTLNKESYDFTGEGKITVIDGTSTNALANIMESVKEVLNIEGIKKNIIIYEMDDGSAISSESTYKLYKDNEEVILEEDAIGIYSVGNSNDEIRSANNKIYINELPKGKYKLIGDNNKEVKFEIDESGKIIGKVKENTKETRKLVSTAVAELIIMIQTGIEKVNYIMIILTLLVTISSLLYIVKKVNVKES